jgi:hypothetical protein
MGFISNFVAKTAQIIKLTGVASAEDLGFRTVYGTSTPVQTTIAGSASYPKQVRLVVRVVCNTPSTTVTITVAGATIASFSPSASSSACYVVADLDQLSSGQYISTAHINNGASSTTVSNVRNTGDLLGAAVVVTATGLTECNIGVYGG